MEGSYSRILMMCGMLALLLCGGCWVFAWKHLRRRIDERFDVLSEHLERHAAECRYGRSTCWPRTFRRSGRKGNGSFHRSFGRRIRVSCRRLGAGAGDHAGGGNAVHADQDEPEQPGDRRQDVYLHRKLAHHPLPAETEDAAGGRQGHGRMGTGDRIGSWGGELLHYNIEYTPLSKKNQYEKRIFIFRYFDAGGVGLPHGMFRRRHGSVRPQRVAEFNLSDESDGNRLFIIHPWEGEIAIPVHDDRIRDFEFSGKVFRLGDEAGGQSRFLVLNLKKEVERKAFPQKIALRIASKSWEAATDTLFLVSQPKLEAQRRITPRAICTTWARR